MIQGYHQWICRSEPHDLVFDSWPHRSPDNTPCDVMLLGYTKSVVCVSPLPTSLHELKYLFLAAVESVTTDMQKRECEEFFSSVDLARLTMGSCKELL